MAPGESLPAGVRFVVIDASRLQAPGATGTDDRVPIAMALRTLQVLEVPRQRCADGKHEKALPAPCWRCRRGRSRLGAGPRPECSGQQGAAVLVRLHPCSVVLCDASEPPFALAATFTRQNTETRRTVAAVIQSTGGPQTRRGGVHASRVSAEHGAARARHTGRQRHTKGAPQAESRFRAGGVLVFTTLAPAGLSAQPLMRVYRGRWHIE